jgi:FAD/FMN-containing dehydrogenase
LEGKGPFLAYGLGRSYGDSCLNEGGTIIRTSQLNRFVSFDPTTRILRCEAGVSFAEIIEVFLPRGYFVPVTPGTKFVTVGGAIANDVHGKNHHHVGTFGRFVKSLALLRSTGEIIECSPELNRELFAATIGGLGLTGLILWADVQLLSVPGPYIDEELVRFDCLDRFFEIEKSSIEFEYTVAWMDCVTTGKNLGRGIFIRGNHSNRPADPDFTVSTKPRFTVPLEAPNWTLNRFSISTFNQLYYHKAPAQPTRRCVLFDPFFYPLDAIGEWNKIYGRRGFFQYQFAIPESSLDAVREALRTIAESGQASFLVVMKRFGDIPSPGMLSFPLAGYTLTLDFPNRGGITRKLFERLDDIVRNGKGRLYPAKDSTMKGRDFAAFYPELPRFEKYIDPQFSSSFWRRMRG